MNETRSCSVGSLQITARGADLFRYPDKEEAQGKKGKKDRQRRRANRDARNHDLLAKLEAAAASPSRAPMEDQAEEPADATPEAGSAARAAALRRTAVALLGADQAVALLGAEQCSEALDAKRRRKQPSDVNPMTAAEAIAAAEAEGLQLQSSDNAAGFRGVRRATATTPRPFYATYGPRTLGSYATAEEAALAYTRACAPDKAARAAEAAAEARQAAERAKWRAEARAARAQKQAEEHALAKAKAEADRAAREAARKFRLERYGESDVTRTKIIELAQVKFAQDWTNTKGLLHPRCGSPWGELVDQISRADPACLPAILESLQALESDRCWWLHLDTEPVGYTTQCPCGKPCYVAAEQRAFLALPVHRCSRCAPRCQYLGHVLCNDRCWLPNGLHFPSPERDPDGAERTRLLALAMAFKPQYSTEIAAQCEAWGCTMAELPSLCRFPSCRVHGGCTNGHPQNSFRPFQGQYGGPQENVLSAVYCTVCSPATA